MAIIWVVFAGFLVAFGISFMATPVSCRISRLTGMMDMPQKHKAHSGAMPMLGGSAIVLAIGLPSLLVLAMVKIWTVQGIPVWLPESIARHIAGAESRRLAALGILCGAFVLHVMGLIDDRRPLGPILKLIVQTVVCAFVVIFCGVRIMEFAGGFFSCVVSILWMVMITNAFNFLDNMDGLTTGIAAICAAALLGAAAGLGQVFVAAWLCLILGALLGFLPYNFPPAKTYMGDGGSLVIGYLMAAVTCMTTYSQPVDSESLSFLYGMFVPLVLMAIPLYDMFSVIVIRIRDGRSPLVGDRKHFSHRLERRGLTVRVTVLTVYVCTAGTAIAASLLPHVADPIGVILVFAQTIMILLVIALLETADRRP